MLLMVALVMGLVLAALVVAMSCTTQTYYVDGRYIVCQTCCIWGNCLTTCF